MSARRFRVQPYAPHAKASLSFLVCDSHHPEALPLATCMDRRAADAIAAALGADPTRIDEIHRYEEAF